MKSVWIDLDRENTQYIPRCSRCGGFKEDLKTHWFFTGIYCVPCIRYTYYDDVEVPYYSGG